MVSTVEKELEDLMMHVESSMIDILLSEDRTSKHPSYSWTKESIEQHLLKASRHINTALQINKGFDEPDEENHLHNAITRLAMAVFLAHESAEEKTERLHQEWLESEDTY